MQTLSTCAGDVSKAYSANQQGCGGVIPASALHFHTNCVADAEKLVLTYHYSRRIPSNVQFIGSLHLAGGLFGDFGEAVAAAFFTFPPTRWTEEVLELSRLVRKDGIRLPLTLLIRLCCGRLRAGGHALLVSFADRTAGHHGGIYQAAGWNYHGAREAAMDGLVINGTFRPGRSCNSTYGTRSPSRLAEKMPDASIEPHYDLGKHLYWKSLSGQGNERAERLQLKKKPYPKG